MTKPTGLYVDNGRVITTHSMLQTFLQCPNKARYKYAERLKKRVLTERDLPLTRGTWFHALLEDHYVGKDWRVMHAAKTAKYEQLMDVERDSLGDLPAECARLMKSYLWHYGADREDPYHGWEMLDTELTLECEWPDGEGIYRCRLDLMMQDQFGLWIVDHKTNKRLPSMSFRQRDAASALYIWAAWQNGLHVNGFMWNYVKTKPPTKPELVYVGKPNERLSTRNIDTDYPTMHRAITEYGLVHADYKTQLLALKRDRWRDGAPQSSPFFRRDILEKDADMVARVVGAAMRTRDRMHTYEWAETDSVERVASMMCDWCDFNQLCETELFGGDGNRLRRQLYRVGDPLDYYQDDRVRTD